MPGVKRQRMTRERVLLGALQLADEVGVADLTIRRLADALDSRPMTIYHYVSSKEEILDGIVDLVLGEIELPNAELDWKPAMRARCVSAREVLARHPWAVQLIDSRRSPGPATLRHSNAVIASLRSGLSLTMTAHAYAMLDAYVYGFVIQEASIPTSDEEMTDVVEGMMDEQFAQHFPDLHAFTVDHVLQAGYDFRAEFDFGLDLILDRIEALADQH